MNLTEEYAILRRVPYALRQCVQSRANYEWTLRVRGPPCVQGIYALVPISQVRSNDVESLRM